MSAESATYGLWIVWYVTWIGAVIWSKKTTVQMKQDFFDPSRPLATLGIALLFLVPATPANSPKLLFGIAATRHLIQRLWPQSEWVGWILFALVAAGFAFCWWARLHLGALWSGYVTLKEGHHIVDTGPYRMVRHPIYSGVLFSALATAVLKASPTAFVGFALLAVGFWMVARIEERFLREQLGAEAYDGYSQRTPMLVPWVG